jgi:hypothetical protein
MFKPSPEAVELEDRIKRDRMVEEVHTLVHQKLGEYLGEGDLLTPERVEAAQTALRRAVHEMEVRIGVSSNQSVVEQVRVQLTSGKPGELHVTMPAKAISRIEMVLDDERMFK